MYFDIKTLEFDKIKKQIASYIFIDETFTILNDLNPSNDIEYINKKLAETFELRKIIISFGNIPFYNPKNFNNILKKLEILQTLNLDDILTIYQFNYSINSIIEYQKTFIKNNFSSLNLIEYFNNLSYIKEVKLKIEEIVDMDKIILDTASKELFNIRKNIKLMLSKIRTKLQEIIKTKHSVLTDGLVVMRNNRYCLGVKLEYKNQFKGVIHDESASGQTIYIEPESVLILTNNLFSLENEEKNEISKILYNLTIYLNKYLEDFKRNYINISLLDFIHAKAKYANEIEATKPNLCKSHFKLINARHPLIDKNKVVPISIELGLNHKGIIITGPNTGGKTVTLKTVGLLTIMAQSGILIPCSEDSIIEVFDNIYSDIGDEQSIEQNLSTFSSHLKKLINITSNIKSNSLLLIDELGSGTDPIEGSALARSILKYINHFDVRSIITSHYAELKEFAFQNDYFVNASVLFNVETLEPTYKLKIGIPGRSNALEISKRLGLKEEIIEDAKNILDNQSSDVSKIIKKLEKQEYELNLLQNDLKEKLSFQETLNKNLEERIKFLDLEKDKILKEARIKENNYINELKKKAEELLDQIKTKTLEHEIAQVKYDLKNLTAKNFTLKDEEEHRFEVDDVVYIISIEKEGIIKKIIKDEAMILLGNITLKYKLSDLRFLRKYKKPSNKKILSNSFDTSTIKKDCSFVLDLRGFRYEEAKDALDKYFDNALLCNIKQFRIIHGFGTGTIRKLVWDYLKVNKYVKEYRYGQEGEGLNGATVVSLK